MENLDFLIKLFSNEPSKTMKYNCIEILSDHQDLNKLFCHWRKLYTATHDKWPALFRTKEHKRRVRRCDKMAARFINATRAKFNIKDYDVKRLEDVGYAVVWRTDK